MENTHVDCSSFSYVSKEVEILPRLISVVLLKISRVSATIYSVI